MTNMIDSDSTQTLLLIAIFALASLLHGISGLGVTLVTTTALASMYPLPHAIVLVIFPSLLLNAMTWLAGGGRTVWQNFIYYGRRYWLLALTSLLGSILGAKLLLWVDSAYILLVLAAVIGFYVSSALLGKQVRLPDTKPVLIIVGFSAGIIGGATNAMSTILMMYLLSASNDKNTIAKVGNMCYFLGKIAQIIVLREPIMALSNGEWQLIALLSVLSISVLLIGIRLRRYLPQARFRQLILLILTVLGLRVGWQGVMAFL
ncbi:sulfite exporter TauE/SafE family protein [Psychrobacter sp. AOP22-C1-22]|uniref:sulfite exporter TauE/SafE family protein n=1 Tax=unclassified Psychrobacter TaxID=196806 RepID=UPI0017882D02|nr:MULTISPECIES: sulfite exporter TauE/SafE family protein [unclassified Psychrobacter]MDN5801705.1 sulfite exporter TauE/SafE family protein [Psychrobacter sp.]MBE0406896.1 sulfite exporter TauE/SafE family protein [Psychrobacter sp. FME6]MBE0444987.1 sulfite exporter TauE/SafE family protein [Psychrobacter sp. FME5]MDN5890606.1 sulfite exporter TauE/SafE family protein [Psychrobacter sp.]MDN5897334.1 sulfite exporter TauE/SafE family protein [Psychrobacter sp.]